MWLPKIFSERKDAHDDADEQRPTAKPPVVVMPPAAAPVAPRKVAPKPQLKIESPESSGFDPYNSGSFQRKGNAWERVTRRS